MSLALDPGFRRENEDDVFHASAAARGRATPAPLPNAPIQATLPVTPRLQRKDAAKNAIGRTFL
jgi:hypothetical protein